MAEEKKWQLELSEYIRQGEPEQAEKSEAWQIAIGLQQVESQSVISKAPKVQNDTLKCTLEEMAVLKLMMENPSITQKELLNQTGKSLSTVKRIVASLQQKGYIQRINGKRYGKWEVLIGTNENGGS